MNLTDDYTLKFLRGSPVLLDDICAIYCATLGEIADLGYSKFQTFLGAITTVKPVVKSSEDAQLSKLLMELSDFQYILMLTAIDQKTNEILKQAFHFFTHQNASFSLEPAQIIIGPPEEKHILNEEKFYEFRQIINRAYFLQLQGEQIIINSDDSQQVRLLKQKMLENRQKVRKAKAKQAAKEKNELKFSDYIASITINNCGLNMQNIWNITYYAFHDQLKRMGWRDQFDMNNRAALAGAKLKKNQLKHWMRSIASSDK